MPAWLVNAISHEIYPQEHSPTRTKVTFQA